MKCKKCGMEIPDLTMYCPECGAPQFEAPKTEVKLHVPGLSKSKVVINEIANMTNAITVLRNQSGKPIPEIRRMLSQLPMDYRVNLSVEDANVIVQDLLEQGIKAEAVHPQGFAPTEEKQEPAPEMKEEPQLTLEPKQPVPEETQEEVVGHEEPQLTMEPEQPAPEETKEETVGHEEPQLTLEPQPPVAEEAVVANEGLQLTLDPKHPASKTVEEEVDAMVGKMETSGIQLTLDPEHKLDDAFMKEMEDFLNGAK